MPHKFNFQTFLTFYLIFVTFGLAQHVQQESPAETTTIEPIDDREPIAMVLETGDIYVIIRTAIVPQVDNTSLTNVSFQSFIKSSDKWVKVSSKVNSEKLNKGKYPKIGDRYGMDWKLSPLTPATSYQFKVFAVYNDTTYPEDPKAIETTTKALAPAVELVKQSIIMKLEGQNAKTYRVQINEVQENAKVTGPVFDLRMSSSFGKELVIPEMAAGKKYSIKTWFIDQNEIDSQPKIIEHAT